MAGIDPTTAIDETTVLRLQVDGMRREIERLNGIISDLGRIRARSMFGEVSPPWTTEPIWGRLELRAQLRVPGWDVLTAHAGLDEQIWRMAYGPMDALGVVFDEMGRSMLAKVDEKRMSEAR